MRPHSERRAAGAAPTVDEIDRIPEVGDPIIRNLLITDAYHRLAVALGSRTGTAANWCHFAAWASRQGGQTVRGEDLVEALRCGFHLPASMIQPIHSLWRKVLAAGLDDPATRLGRIVRAVQGPLDPLERPSEAVAQGNPRCSRRAPASLRPLNDPGAIAVLQRFRCDADGLDDRGARDWAQLDERMHFIAHLFRAFQEDASLASAPFTEEQLVLIRARRIPEGDV